MASQTLRRRPHHDEFDGYLNTQSSSLKQPLLGDNGYDDSGAPDTLDDKKESLHWSLIFTRLIAQWAQWLGSILVGSGSFLGRLISFPFTIQNEKDNNGSLLYFSPLLEERLRILRERLQVSYDSCHLVHQDALRQLWMLAYPNREVPPLKSDLWKEMGWQGCDPSTDFRGGGFISLENLIFFAKNYPVAFQRLLLKRDGNRSEWEYPFAVAGINISFMLAQMLELQSGMPTSVAGIRFLELLKHDEMAFDNLYCVAFTLMDAQWLAKRASYMEFNDVLKSTKTQLERELALEDVSRVEDLPSYHVLNS